ncbi:MAG: PAS domain S-box protein [Thermoplasmata archaeon]|nr:PAS domain S-box protein [Thermoplasmata archaeon]
MTATRVLIVEDESIVAMDIQTTLESLGYEVVGTASTGERAIVLAEEKRPDLILMDIVLKGDMDGVEAAQQVHSILDIPIVYLTAYSDDRTLQRAKLTEPFGYILKPFEERELHTNIEMALHKHRLEKTLRESEEKFRTVTQSAKDAIIKVNNDGLIVLWNPAAEKIFGYSAGEVLGKNLHDLLAPARYHDAHRDGWPDFQRMGEGAAVGRTLELMANRKDGAEIPVELSLSAVQVAGKWNAIGIMRDISERKEAQRVLEESEAQLRDLFDNATDLIQQVGPDGTILSVNRAWCETLCYTREEAVGMNIFEVICPDHREECMNHFQGIMSGGSLYLMETEFQTKHGRRIIVEGNVNSKTVDGEFVYSRGFFRDITERREAERARQESESRFATVIEEANDGIIIIQDGKVRFANPKTLEVSGYPSDEIQGMDLFDIIGPEHRELVAERYIARMEGRDVPSQYEIEILRKDGGLVPVEVNATLMAMDGKPAVIAFVRDITERRRTEQLEREKAKGEVYGFLVSSLPVFAGSVPANVREELIRTFAERFEEMMRPRFIESAVCAMPGAEDLPAETVPDLECLLEWVRGLFRNLGIGSTVVRNTLDLTNCPWVEEARGNPVFCLICRTMVIRSSTWTGISGSVEHASSLASGGRTCRFIYRMRKGRSKDGV